MKIKNATITNTRNFKVDDRLDAVSIEATFEYRNRQYVIKFIDAGFKTQVLEIRNTEGRKVNFVGTTVDAVVEVVLAQMAAEVVESESAQVEGEAVTTEVSVTIGDDKMNIEAIKQNAEITSTSVCGRHFNRVAITCDEFDYLTTLIGRENPYKNTGDDYVEMDYHGEFIPLIEHAEIVKEQEKIEREEIRAWKAANNMFEDEDENYYHG